MRLVNCKREKRILPRPQGRPVDLLTTRRWMGNAFIHSIVCQSTALRAHHPNKRECVYGFSLSPLWKLPQGAWCLFHNKVLSLFIPVTFHHEGKKRCPKGFGGRNNLQALRERQPYSMSRPCHPTKTGETQTNWGCCGEGRAGWTREVSSSPRHTCWIWWRQEIKYRYPKNY